MSGQSVPRFTSVADHGLLVDFSHQRDGEESDGDVARPATTSGSKPTVSTTDADIAAANVAVVALDRALAGATIDGVAEVVPALVNLLIEFDPIATDHEAVEQAVRSLLPVRSIASVAPATHHVPVCYDDSLGVDLAAVANACDLSVDAVVDAHLAGDYRVLMYGFAPGYAYLGGVRAEIQVPRKPTVVRGVAAGSVIIAGAQCLITTITMPTGWSVIGASPTRVLPSHPDQPFLFDPGDRIVFERVDLTEFERLRRLDEAQ